MPRPLMDIDKFKAGLELVYDVVYLGSHTTNSTNVPKEVLEREFEVPGSIVFTLQTFAFVPEAKQDDKFKFAFHMEEIEREQMDGKEKILFVTMNFNGEKERFYFDVAREDGEGSVYHPQWVRYAKRYNEEKQNRVNESFESYEEY